jgi:hypothetical protein
MQTASRQHGVLCAVCQDALSSCDLTGITEFKGVNAPHHQSYTSLLRSLEEGCYICNRLWTTLTSKERRLAHNQTTVGRPYLPSDGALDDGTTTTEPRKPLDKFPVTQLRLEGGPYRVSKHYTISLDLSGEPRTILGRSLEFLMQNLNDTGTCFLVRTLHPFA